ncbi:hypothetical protein [Nitrosovibrio sp. Nv4]|uniref:hypothetical protein n=1 Tax=Nitrosovibrio sp. Nv4 TaxID=1945880 RepID=UPI000BC39E8E|nr:hypothetical protein [Nitrosovibrio sp. Nv4]SOD41323.1 hypothetical protein SAMN06298226_1618 [Nitrosovibrio sp. Nv4]
MADRYYSVVLGEHTIDKVTEGAASVAGDAIEVRVTYDATGMSKQAALFGLRAIEDYIKKDAFPPA